MKKIWAKLFDAESKYRKLKCEYDQAEWEFEQLSKLIKYNVIYSGFQDHGDSGTEWWVFPVTLNNDEIQQNLIDLGIVEDTDRGVWDDNDWDCSGQTMVYAPSIRRSNTRVLVTQYYCLDV